MATEPNDSTGSRCFSTPGIRSWRQGILAGNIAEMRINRLEFLLNSPLSIILFSLLATVPSPSSSTVQDLVASLFSSPNQQWACSRCTSAACGWKTTVMQQFCLGLKRPFSGRSWNGGLHSHWKKVSSLLQMKEQREKEKAEENNSYFGKDTLPLWQPPLCLCHIHTSNFWDETKHLLSVQQRILAAEETLAPPGHDGELWHEGRL